LVYNGARAVVYNPVRLLLVSVAILRRNNVGEVVELSTMPSPDRLDELSAVHSDACQVVGLSQEAIDKDATLHERLVACCSDVDVGGVRNQ